MLYKTYESFNEDKNIRDLAWLYFLHITYNGELSIKTWGKDNRMGVKLSDSMEKFQLKGLVDITDDFYKSNSKAFNILLNYFESSSMEEAFKKSIDLKSYSNEKDYDEYPINKIPIKFWKKLNQEKEDVIDDWHDSFFTPWWNTHGNDLILKRWLKKNGKENQKMINEFNLRKYYYPNPLPKEIIIYRGLKAEYTSEHNKEYTSWTLDLDQGKRFAKYHFSKGFTAKPDESKIQILLEAHVNIKDIVMFVGGEEHEVILKEPVKIYKKTRIK